MLGVSGRREPKEETPPTQGKREKCEKAACYAEKNHWQKQVFRTAKKCDLRNCCNTAAQFTQLKPRSWVIFRKNAVLGMRAHRCRVGKPQASTSDRPWRDPQVTPSTAKAVQGREVSQRGAVERRPPASWQIKVQVKPCPQQKQWSKEVVFFINLSSSE